MMVLSAMGAGLLTVLKWLAKALLGILGLVLGLAKIILLLFGMVAGIFLAFVRAGTP